MKTFFQSFRIVLHTARVIFRMDWRNIPAFVGDQFLLTLQPFVENAILHGLRVTQEAGGTVSVNGWMEEGRIVLAVTDDGVGMSEDALKRSLEHGGSHYGMKNIRSRLSIFYHEEIALEVESTPGAGTCVSINIPAVAKEENHA